MLRVKDSQQALEDLGQVARAQFGGIAVAITGSVGKTTTKEMMAQAFGALGSTHAAIKSYNNFMGVPFTLATLPSTAQYAVFEVGMNHANETLPPSPT